MPHEHLLIDLRCIQVPAPPALGVGWADRPVTPDIRADVVHWPQTNVDDLVLDDEAIAIDEVARFKAAGGGTIVDATTIGIGRDPAALRRISEASGVHVSMGTGWYVAISHPPEIAARSEDDLADQMVREIEEGIAAGDGDVPIRAGHIGEIGCEGPTDLELKVLRAAVQAQARTGAMLLIHQLWRPGDLTTAHGLLDVVERGGGRVDRTVLAHMDRTGLVPDLQRSLLERGATILYDIWGYESSRGNAWERPMISDTQRIRDFARLIDAGFGGQLLAAQDICFKTMATTWGGHGYAHILRRVVPGMRALGLSEEDIFAILIANPARLLAFVTPSA
jgi:phosphotriesterase-related protein